MKSFKKFVAEVAQPKSKEEKNFKDQHSYEVVNHPVADPAQHTGDIGAPGLPKAKAKRKADQEGDANYDKTYSKKDDDGVKLESKEMATRAALDKASDSSKEGKKAVSLKKAPWDKTEALVGGQKKLDHDKDGDIDGLDFAALRAKKKKKNEETEESVELDEALPPHLQKHFDKDGNASKGKWVGTGKNRKWVPTGGIQKSTRVMDVTPKGYGPNEEVELSEFIDTMLDEGYTLDDAINAILEQELEEGSIKGSGTDRKAQLKKAYRDGEQKTRDFYKNKITKDPRTSDKGIKKAFQKGANAGDGSPTAKGGARSKSQDRLKGSEHDQSNVSPTSKSFRSTHQSKMYNIKSNKPKLPESFDLSDFTQEEIIDFMMTEDFAQLDELSKKTLGSYVKKASRDVANRSADNARDYAKGNRPVGMNKKGIKNWKREIGIDKAVDKMTKESIEETTSSALKRAVTQTGPDGKTRTVMKKLRSDKTDNRGQDSIQTRESVELDEAVSFKKGPVKLKDGKQIMVSAQDATLLNKMFKDLSPANQKQMEKVAMMDKAGFDEIVGFAREAL